MSSENAVKSLPERKELKSLHKLLEKAVEDEIFPGAVLMAGEVDNPAHMASYGFTAKKTEELEPKATELDTVYDIGLLTGPLVSTILMHLVEEGRISLSDRVGRYLQGFSVHGKSRITVEQLLTHTAGFPATFPFYEELVRIGSGSRIGILTSRGAKDYILNEINRSKLRYEPGTKQQSSTLGYMLIGFIIESLTGLNLATAAYRYIFRPLQLKSSSFIDIGKLKSRDLSLAPGCVAPTEECSWRKKMLCGEVQDENAWAMGGVAGHSGVFSTASDIYRFGSAMVKSFNGEEAYLSKDIIRRFWEPCAEYPDGLLHGWERLSNGNDYRELKLAEETFGMLSPTGCALWLVPKDRLVFVLMSNRMHPSRGNKKFFSFFPKLVKEALTHLSPRGV